MPHEIPSTPERPKEFPAHTIQMTPEDAAALQKRIRADVDRPHATNLTDTRILGPDEVPPELRVFQDRFQRAKGERPLQQPPTPEETFQAQKNNLLKYITEVIKQTESRIDRVKDQLQHPVKRFIGPLGAPTDESFSKEIADAEESLLAEKLKEIFVRASKSKTSEEFNAELARAEADAAKELSAAFGSRAEKNVLESKQRTLHAITELKRLTASSHA